MPRNGFVAPPPGIVTHALGYRCHRKPRALLSSRKKVRNMGATKTRAQPRIPRMSMT